MAKLFKISSNNPSYSRNSNHLETYDTKNQPNLTPDQALQMLKDGNQRFVTGLRSIHTLIDRSKIEDLAKYGQRPIAIVLTCSDSRVPTEIIFDRGLGDLYVLRVAGNILSNIFISSIEYALTFFYTPICLVLGHTQCGAMQAAYHSLQQSESLPPSPHLRMLIQSITKGLPPSSDLQHLTWYNVKNNIQILESESQIVRERLQQNQLKLIGGVYNIGEGRVYFEQD